MSKITFDDHSEFRKILSESSLEDRDGLKIRKDKNKPIGDNEVFQNLGKFIDKIIQKEQLPLRKKELRGSYSWQASDTRLGGATLIKLCHYDIDDYFFGLREDWVNFNDIKENVIKKCSFRFVVPPKVSVEFIGFPCLASADLDCISETINMIPKK